MERGKGIPKEREVNKRREVCGWEGCERVKLYRAARGGSEKSFANCGEWKVCVYLQQNKKKAKKSGRGMKFIFFHFFHFFSRWSRTREVWVVPRQGAPQTMRASTQRTNINKCQDGNKSR